MDYLTYPQLRELGIPYSREHIRRLEKAGKFPLHLDLDENGRRIAWERVLIEKHLANKDRIAREGAKAARAKARQLSAAAADKAAQDG